MKKVLAGDRAHVEIGWGFFQQFDGDALIAYRRRAGGPEPQLVEAGLKLGAEETLKKLPCQQRVRRKRSLVPS